MSAFQLSDKVDHENVFILNFSDIEYRYDPLYYKSVNNLAIVNDTTHPVKKISEVVKMQRGRFGHRPRNDPEFYGGEYPFIQTGDIVKASQSDGKIRHTQTLNEKGLKTSRLFEPDVLVITIAANIGDTAILDYAACFPDSLVALKPKDEDIDIHYLNVYLKLIKPHLENLAPQAAQKNINLQQLSPIPVVVPPMDVQKKVAEKYNVAVQAKKSKNQQAKNLLASIDDYLLGELGIELPEKQVGLDKRIFTVPFINNTGKRWDAFYHQEFFDTALSSIRKGKFACHKIADVIDGYLIKGRLPKAEEKDGRCKVVQISSINGDGAIDIDELLTAHDIFTKDQQLFQKDILVVITGATIGKIAFWDLEGDYKLGGDIVKFQTNGNADPYYVFNYLLSEPAQIQIKRNITGATNGHLAPIDVKNMLIPFPPMDKQTEIAHHIRQIREKAKQLQQEADNELKKASQEVYALILNHKR